MAKLPIRWIEARTYRHATEDEGRVGRALDFAVPGGTPAREVLQGHFGNELVRLTRGPRALRDDGPPARRKAMQILLALSHLSEAERLVPVTSAHVSGASYKMIGDPGLEFLEDFARDARVTVPTTVNPLGTDLRQWRDLGIPAEFADNQERIARAYGSLGFRPRFSCTPYLIA